MNSNGNEGKTLLLPPKELHNFNFVSQDKEMQRESFGAREVLYLKLAGWSNKRIAAKLERSSAWVCTVCRQPWFVEEMIANLHHRGEQEVDKVLKTVCDDAIAIAQAIMHDPGATNDVRARCAFEFIKAHKGTKLVVEDKLGSLKDLKAEEERLKVEVAELEGINRVAS